MNAIPTAAEIRRRLGLFRPAYRTRELLRELGLDWSRGRLLRILREYGIVPRRGLIWVSDIHARMPQLWQSLILVRGVHEPVAEILERLAADLVQTKEEGEEDGGGADGAGH